MRSGVIVIQDFDKAYIVFGCTGADDSFVEWPVKAFRSEEGAMSLKLELEEDARKQNIPLENDLILILSEIEISKLNLLKDQNLRIFWTDCGVQYSIVALDLSS